MGSPNKENLVQFCGSDYFSVEENGSPYIPPFPSCAIIHAVIQNHAVYLSKLEGLVCAETSFSKQ